MDAVEQWLRDKAEQNTLVNPTELADEWHDRPAVALIPYQGGGRQDKEVDELLADFLAATHGPAMIGLDPVVYPACSRCSQAWKMRRSKGVWAWTPDCSHKTASCKLVRA